jgi:hypothetical protein
MRAIAAGRPMGASSREARRNRGCSACVRVCRALVATAVGRPATLILGAVGDLEVTEHRRSPARDRGKGRGLPRRPPHHEWGSRRPELGSFIEGVPIRHQIALPAA